ncbi:VOC family protein [Oceanobacillus manasiensis]|uniref:VOC family protein n=1 Tax=Oceanobacillus manasiensis TaxID=586413 RepID=UPI0005A650D0|nr:VOC family protein [Oceanobacillus manasiensis]
MTYHFKEIDHIQLAAPIGSEQQARDFYVGILGFEEVEKPVALKPNGGVWFQAGNVHIHIGTEKAFIPAKKAHPAIHILNLDALKQHLIMYGISFKVDDKLPGAIRFYVEDPYGNRIEFLEWLD